MHIDVEINTYFSFLSPQVWVGVKIRSWRSKHDRRKRYTPRGKRLQLRQIGVTKLNNREGSGGGGRRRVGVHITLGSDSVIRTGGLWGTGLAPGRREGDGNVVFRGKSTVVRTNHRWSLGVVHVHPPYNEKTVLRISDYPVPFVTNFLSVFIYTLLSLPFTLRPRCSCVTPTNRTGPSRNESFTTSCLSSRIPGRPAHVLTCTAHSQGVYSPDVRCTSGTQPRCTGDPDRVWSECSEDD